MNTRGLMELIVLNIGLDLGVISPTLFTMMIIMALVTTFMTSPLLERIYPAHVAEADETEPATQHGGFTVLACVAYDRSGPAMATVAGALLGETDDAQPPLRAPPRAADRTGVLRALAAGTRAPRPRHWRRSWRAPTRSASPYGRSRSSHRNRQRTSARSPRSSAPTS